MSVITDLRVSDVRFPTSRDLDGSDAMNPDPDYSAAYVVVETDHPDGLEGHGFVFTIGRGNEVVVCAVQALRDHVVGQEAEGLLADMGETWRRLVHDSQLRWLGPEKGVMHMAIGAVVNALWDLRSKRAGQPLWFHLSQMSAPEILDLVDFRYLSDGLTPAEALEILERGRDGRERRLRHLEVAGYPAYTTTPGWLGYTDEKMVRLCREAVSEGFSLVKLKVGADRAEDRRRLRLAREAVGPDVAIAVDANQRWDVDEAVSWIRDLGTDLFWVEEPTSPDDILGHARIAREIAPVRVATGEHVQNRIVFKQMVMTGALQVMQIDATRVAGVNENIANLLLASRYDVPVCPHAGGVGLCEAVQHLSMFDYLAVSGSLEGRYIEYVDHLHDHFVDPVVVRNGVYRVPLAPGASTQMHERTLTDHQYPHGRVWSAGGKA
ncbi:enolase C-terminal domain-like protein [Ornithinimicrobium sp. W1679]|uniref:enolase C-terminal domain-like protein n=1 Tax=Ornithinimicrobium sp. W1679 TaxID=3418770 RepID=UPI003CF7A651